MRRTCITLPYCAAAFLWFIPVGELSAHPGPHHDIQQLTESLKQSPDRADLLLRRAEAYRDNGDFELSLADLDRVARIDPCSRLISLQRGLTLSAMKKDAEAETELTKYILVGGENPRALVERGRLRERGNRLAAAIEDYSAALAARADLDVFVSRGQAQQRLGRRREAADGYHEGLRAFPGAIELRLGLIEVLNAQEDYGAALAQVDEAMGGTPAKADWRLRRANILEAAGKIDEASRERHTALIEADHAVTRRPSGLNLLTRAKAHFALGHRDKALRDLRAVFEKTPRLEDAIRLLEQVNSTGSQKEASLHGPK